jgi:hypothetical protein
MSQICYSLHQLFNSLTIYRFPFNAKLLPRNGIYILFEDEEQAHGTNRIVRVGTHTGDNQLPSRLQQHFVKENKDRSIFRKNIGRAILSRNQDPFLDWWELDLTSSEAKQKYLPVLDLPRQKQIESQVSGYIQQHLCFVVFQVDDKDKRLEWESKIISTVSWCTECGPSMTWLGNFSPKEKIQKSGLWIVNELYKTPLSEGELQDLINSVYAISKPYYQMKD